MMKKSLKPFKKVTIEYYEDISGGEANTPETTRKIKVVTTTEKVTGSSKDPVISVGYESL
jgi:hypothetical protein